MSEKFGSVLSSVCYQFIISEIVLKFFLQTFILENPVNKS